MNIFMINETGKFKVTFNIKEDAKGDQTIELEQAWKRSMRLERSSLMSGLRQKTERRNWMMHSIMSSTIRQSFDGVEYIYNPVNGTASLYEEPLDDCV